MLRKYIHVFWFLLFAFTAPVAAQLTDVTGHAGFTGQSVKFEFNDLMTDSDASRALAAWGITFNTDGSGSDRVFTVVRLGFADNRIRNVPGSGDSADHPMILNFKDPVQSVGFIASNGTAETQVSVTAFGPAGEEIGTIQHDGLDAETLIEVRTEHPSGIAKLVISYGTAAEAEEIDDLQVEYLARPEFRTYLAQLGNGVIPNVGTLRSTLVVANLSNSTAEGQVEFFSDDGSPVDFQFGENAASSLSLTIPAASSTTLVTAGSDLSVGYARISTNVPVVGTGIFRILSPTDSLVAEAGVGSATGTYSALGAVQKVVDGDFDSGVAVVNISGATANARLELIDQLGHVVASNATLASIGPGEHRAQFVSQIFPDFAGSSFTGTIRIVSDVPLAVVILRTASGLVRSSLPVGSQEQ